jgi:LysM domain
VSRTRKVPWKMLGYLALSVLLLVLLGIKAIGGNDPMKNGMTNTPSAPLSQQLDTGTAYWPPQPEPATNTEDSISDIFTPSPIIPISGGPEIGNPVAETFQPKPTCKPLKIANIEGLADWPYTVKTGDTLSAITEYFLGDAMRWPEIYNRNPESFGDLPIDGSPPKIYPGQQIVIPHVASPRYVTVIAGDTLTNIGGMVYGNDYSSGRFWCAIYEQNRDRIGDDPSIIQAGQTFVIYPIALASENEIMVPPESTFAGLVAAHYGSQMDVHSVCILQAQKFGDLCEDILPFDLLFFPNLPPFKKFRVGPGQVLEDIVSACYGEITEQLMMIARVINRKIVGDDTTFIHVGQVFTLYGCKG